MELQDQINKLKAVIAKLKAKLNGGDVTFGKITCKSWRVVDKSNKTRICATTAEKGNAGVYWKDKEGKHRIKAQTHNTGSVFLPTIDVKKMK